MSRLANSFISNIQKYETVFFKQFHLKQFNRILTIILSCVLERAALKIESLDFRNLLKKIRRLEIRDRTKSFWPFS